ncbi:hypothetical protein LTR64_007450 [Lithohypha guttulata]|uniref:uncharacterized protein n=1 Tax=Lithohypha guttulata TaxID=1690604 RepID=UPI002DDEACC9|nr:hypothetical protein LTR51_006784 [Lithohypha guttulata]
MSFLPTTLVSPTSPTRKRRSLRVSGVAPSYEAPNSTLNEVGDENLPLYSSNSSPTSSQQFSETTPRPLYTGSKRPSSSRLSIGSNISTGLASNAGYGNLADELEEAWDPDIDDHDISFLSGLQEGDPDVLHSPASNGMRELDLETGPPSPAKTNPPYSPRKPPSPSKQWASMGTHQKTESLYDGSDYGPSSDDEAFDSITPTLQRRIHDVEEITRISSNADSLSESGGVIARTTASLRDGLAAQSNIESGTTRLITAYNSMATHRSHQSRELMNVSHALISSLANSILNLPTETLEIVIAELDSLTQALPFLSMSPQPCPTPLNALQTFANNTQELLALMHGLSDTLTEHRQYLLTATRRLKSVRELVNDLITEEELLSTSIMLIQAGDWDRRCKERHAGKAVTEVLEGFRKSWGIDYVEGAWRPTTVKRRSIAVR